MKEKNKKKLIIFILIIAILGVIGFNTFYTEFAGTWELCDANEVVTDNIRESKNLKGTAKMNIDVVVTKGSVEIEILNEKNKVLWKDKFNSKKKEVRTSKLRGFKKLKMKVDCKDANVKINYTFRHKFFDLL